MAKNNWAHLIDGAISIAEWDQAVAQARDLTFDEIRERLTSLCIEAFSAPDMQSVITTLMIVSEAHEDFPAAIALAHPSGRATLHLWISPEGVDQT